MPVTFNWTREGGKIVSAPDLPKENFMKKIRVKMIRNKKASVDGINEIILRRGQYYDFNPNSAKQLIDGQYCIEDKGLAGPPETKKGAKKGTKKRTKK